MGCPNSVFTIDLLGSPKGAVLEQPLGQSWVLKQRARGIEAELICCNFGSFYFMSRLCGKRLLKSVQRQMPQDCRISTSLVGLSL